MSLLDDVVRRDTQLLSKRSVFEYLWQELADYILIRKSNITVQRSPGTKQTEKLFSSHAIWCNETLAATMHGSLTSSAAKWYSLKVRPSEANDLYEVRQWLEECARRMYLALRWSNFSPEIHEIYLDLGAFGTGAKLVEEKEAKTPGFNGLQFKSIPMGSYTIAENSDGVVDTLFRQFDLSAIAALMKWGDAVGEKIKGTANGTLPDTMFKFTQAIYPRINASGGPLSTDLPWASVYFCKNPKILISESGYHEFPVMVPRWLKTSFEDYGRGCGHTALPDIKSLNKARQLGFKAWAKNIDPPMTATHGGVIGSIRLRPAGVTVVRRHEALKVMDSGARFDVSTIKEAELKESIRQIFHIDMIEAFLSSNTPQKTATEVQLRYELMQQILGPTLGRLENELLNPLIERVFNIMMRADALPKAPLVLKEYGAELDIEYESPLARAQRSGELMAIERTYSLAGSMADAAPDIFDNFDHDKVIQHTSKITGMPVDLLRSEEKKKEIRAARAEMLKEEKERENFMQMAKGAKDAGAAADKIVPIMKEAEA